MMQHYSIIIKLLEVYISGVKGKDIIITLPVMTMETYA